MTPLDQRLKEQTDFILEVQKILNCVDQDDLDLTLDRLKRLQEKARRMDFLLSDITEKYPVPFHYYSKYL